jgi:energy-coupling factor transporter ATP-binding protein EcfA2
MMTIVSPPSNPFSTRFIRPGAMPFLFPPAMDVERLVVRMREFNWRGAIVGPHGSGKSTLVESLRAELLRAGRRIIRAALHDGQRALPGDLLASRPWDSDTILILDGYEQLSVWNRHRLERDVGRAGCGLLVTSHRPTQLPELYRTAVDCELLERIVKRLVADGQSRISDDDIRHVFSLHGQNAREALFALYDLQESRSREPSARLY